MILTYLAWTVLGALVIASISLAVYVYVSKYNIGDIIKNNSDCDEVNKAKKWLIEQITSDDTPHVKVGLKDGSGDTVANVDIECNSGHGLRVGDSGYF